jgi:hypothetical protein
MAKEGDTVDLGNTDGLLLRDRQRREQDHTGAKEPQSDIRWHCDSRDGLYHQLDLSVQLGTVAVAVCCRGTSLLPNLHVYADHVLQIFPTRIREIGTSVGVSTQWLFNFTFSLVTPYMIAAWGSYTFTFYAILDIIMATLVFLFLKETKGRSIEEMETIFHSKAAFDVEIARQQGVQKH